MNKKTIILITVIFSLIVIGMFVFAYLMNAEMKQQKLKEQPPLDEVVLYSDITRIDAIQYYSDSKHTIVGEIIMPTPCDLIEVDSVVLESYPEQVNLEFRVINNAENCIQLLTSQRFQVEVSASKEAVFRASFEGRDVELNLIPAPEGKTPKEYELFIKG